MGAHIRTEQDRPSWHCATSSTCPSSSGDRSQRRAHLRKRHQHQPCRLHSRGLGGPRLGRYRPHHAALAPRLYSLQLRPHRAPYRHHWLHPPASSERLVSRILRTSSSKSIPAAPKITKSMTEERPANKAEEEKPKAKSLQNKDTRKGKKKRKWFTWGKKNKEEDLELDGLQHQREPMHNNRKRHGRKGDNNNNFKVAGDGFKLAGDSSSDLNSNRFE